MCWTMPAPAPGPTEALRAGGCIIRSRRWGLISWPAERRSYCVAAARRRSSTRSPPRPVRRPSSGTAATSPRSASATRPSRPISRRAGSRRAASMPACSSNPGRSPTRAASPSRSTRPSARHAARRRHRRCRFRRPRAFAPSPIRRRASRSPIWACCRASLTGRGGCAPHGVPERRARRRGWSGSWPRRSRATRRIATGPISNPRRG